MSLVTDSLYLSLNIYISPINDCIPYYGLDSPDLCTILSGQMVYSVRERCGKQLAHEAPVKADLVSTVPESATPAALGYAKEVWLGTISCTIVYKILKLRCGR